MIEESKEVLKLKKELELLEEEIKKVEKEKDEVRESELYKFNSYFVRLEMKIWEEKYTNNVLICTDRTFEVLTKLKKLNQKFNRKYLKLHKLNFGE